MPEYKECDLVMKGGLTSGVVYPKLITQLAKSYRFVNIGGTSAGAIAAGFSAAAEYRRATGGGDAGFDALDEIPGIVGENLLNLFQPERKYKKLFKATLKLIENKEASKLWFLVKNSLRIKRAIKDLPSSYFGFCSGSSLSGYEIEGLTDWLNLWVERCAGRLTSSGDLPSVPLTFGMLRESGIKLRTITTNLSQRSPVTLPNSGALWMKNEDLEKLFPRNIVEYIVSRQEGFSSNPIVNFSDITSSQYLRMPEGDDMPVLMGIRLSLSFPVLLSAIPFYRNDWSLRLCEDEQKKPRICWFSDGGISSNFPIHLFDSVFPKRPTFGISLGEYDDCRQEKDLDDGSVRNRVFLPIGANQGLTSPVNTIDGLLGFIGAIFNSAKDWQDINQTVLPGYRERIVRLYLKPDEGGLNLSMSSDQIAALTDIGETAGNEILDEFILEEHRWRRLLSSYAAIEEGLETIKEDYGSMEEGSMSEFLQAYRASYEEGNPIAKSYSPMNSGQIDDLIARLDKLANLATDLTGPPIRDNWGVNGNMPRPSASLRVTPSKLLD